MKFEKKFTAGCRSVAKIFHSKFGYKLTHNSNKKNSEIEKKYDENTGKGK